MERQGMLSDEQFFRALRQQRLNGATDALDRPAFFLTPLKEKRSAGTGWQGGVRGSGA